MGPWWRFAKPLALLVRVWKGVWGFMFQGDGDPWRLPFVSPRMSV
jgi:hypothetical protein